MIPSVDQILAVSKEQLKEQILTVSNLKNLVSWRSLLTSKTVLINLAFSYTGIVGLAYHILQGGSFPDMAPFLTTIGISAVNAVLPFFTTGPLITNAMQKMMETLISPPIE